MTPRVLVLGVAVWVGVLSAASGHVQTAAQDQPRAGTAAPTSAVESAALVKRYCVTCHSDRLKTGGLALETLDLGDVAAGASTWEKVVQKLRAGVMPPAGSPRPVARRIRRPDDVDRGRARQGGDEPTRIPGGARPFIG